MAHGCQRLPDEADDGDKGVLVVADDDEDEDLTSIGRRPKSILSR